MFIVCKEKLKTLTPAFMAIRTYNDLTTTNLNVFLMYFIFVLTKGLISEPQIGVTVKHGLKIYSCIRDKWLLFCCRSASEKECWLSALAEERRLVARDRLEGLDFPPAARQLARMAARSHRRPPNKPRSKFNDGIS